MTAYRRGPWTHDEDTRLLSYITEQGGPSNWVTIAQRMESRSAKQCRERYHQNLNPTLNKTPIGEDEGQMIFRLYNEMGPKWAEIARRLDGRSDNAVKNYFNGCSNRRNRAESNRQNERRQRLRTLPPSSDAQGWYSAPPPALPPPSQSRERQPYYGPQYPLPEFNPPSQYGAHVSSTHYQSSQYSMSSAHHHQPSQPVPALVTQYAQPMQHGHAQTTDQPLASPSDSIPSLTTDGSAAQSPYSVLESPRGFHGFDSSRRHSLLAIGEYESKQPESGRLFSQSERAVPLLPPPSQRSSSGNYWSHPSSNIAESQRTSYPSTYLTTLEPQPSAPAPPTHGAGSRPLPFPGSSNVLPVQSQFTLPSNHSRYEPTNSTDNSQSVSGRPHTPQLATQAPRTQSTSPSSRMAVADLVNSN